jgi:tRNA 2-thiouridine synthesizing protein A
MAIPADETLDCVGLFCPMPVLKIRDAIRRLSTGQTVALLSDDPAADADMRSWLARTGHDLLEVERDGPVFRFVVRKTR